MYFESPDLPEGETRIGLGGLDDDGGHDKGNQRWPAFFFMKIDVGASWGLDGACDVMCWAFHRCCLGMRLEAVALRTSTGHRNIYTPRGKKQKRLSTHAPRITA